MSGGWSAVITSPNAGGELTRTTFTVAIAEKQAAEQALEKKLTEPKQRIEMVTEIPSAILNDEGVPTGTIWGLL